MKSQRRKCQCLDLKEKRTCSVLSFSQTVAGFLHFKGETTCPRPSNSFPPGHCVISQFTVYQLSQQPQQCLAGVRIRPSPPRWGFRKCDMRPERTPSGFVWKWWLVVEKELIIAGAQSVCPWTMKLVTGRVEDAVCRMHWPHIMSCVGESVLWEKMTTATTDSCLVFLNIFHKTILDFHPMNALILTRENKEDFMKLAKGICIYKGWTICKNYLNVIICNCVAIAIHCAIKFMFPFLCAVKQTIHLK